MERQRESLLRMVLLQQIEAQSSELRASCARLEMSLIFAEERPLQTIILDWLEAELKTLQQTEDGADAGSQILTATAALLGSLNR